MSSRRLFIRSSVQLSKRGRMSRLLSMKQMVSEPSASGRDKCPFPIDRGRCCCQPRHFQPGLRPHNLAALPHDRTESAQACASAIASLATKSAAVRPEPYALADLHERLEILARAAEALGHAQEAVAIRDMIQRPATVVEADWLHFLEARQTRYRQLDRNLRERRRPYGVGDDPIFELQRIMKVAASRTSPDPPGTAETRQPN